MTNDIKEVVERLERLPQPRQKQEIQAILDRLDRLTRKAESGISAHDLVKDVVGSLEESVSGNRLEKRKALTAVARQHWSGEDGLAYQNRIRSEWEDRPTLEE